MNLLGIKQLNNRNCFEIIRLRSISICSYLIEFFSGNPLDNLAVIKMVVLVTDNHYSDSHIPSVLLVRNSGCQGMSIVKSLKNLKRTLFHKLTSFLKQRYSIIISIRSLNLGNNIYSSYG